MSTESKPRIPQKGTSRHKVFMAITEGQIPVTATKAIAEATDLPIRQVTIARANLRQCGYLPKPTPEMTRETMRSQASAEMLKLVREYRDMGLSPREV